MHQWEVKFSPEANKELQSAIDYYNLQQPGLGLDFLLEFDNQIEHISFYPYACAIRYLNVRFALINRFPYAIHYTIKENINTIIVQTVISAFRNPEEHWKER